MLIVYLFSTSSIPYTMFNITACQQRKRLNVVFFFLLRSLFKFHSFLFFGCFFCLLVCLLFLFVSDKERNNLSFLSSINRETDEATAQRSPLSIPGRKKRIRDVNIIIPSDNVTHHSLLSIFNDS